MKNILFVLTLTLSSISGALIIGCNSTDKKLENAKENVTEAKEELREVQQDVNAEVKQAVDAEEWRAFKAEAHQKIKDNDIRIAELKAKMKKSGKSLDAAYAERIETLEQRNRNLNTKIEAFETSQSDWEKFKREFNQDMTDFGQALKELMGNG